MATALAMASLSLYVLTFNCGLQLIDVPAFASQLFNALESSALPDLLVISLQELAPLSYSFIGGSFLVPYFARIQDAVDLAVRKHADGSTDRYTSVVARHVGGTAIMVFAKDPAAIEGIETAGVGLGKWAMGNKGAVGVRLLYRDANGSGDASTELTFVSAHLAAMEWKLERRNEDWKGIVRGLVFSSTAQERLGNATSLSGSNGEDEQPLLHVSPRDAGLYKPTSHLFVAGDLNYRTSTRSPSSTDYRDSFPQPHHSKADAQHYSKLFEVDQLTQEMAAGRTCHGLIEAPVKFPPTYKYDPEEPFLVSDEDISRWSWAEHRWPSWTDRILYLPVPAWLAKKHPEAKIIAHRYVALPLFPTSDHRAVALSFSVPLASIPLPDEEAQDLDDPRIAPPFPINPNWRVDRQHARTLELLTGFASYFTTTWEGRGVAVATAIGILGGYFMIKALLDF